MIINIDQHEQIMQVTQDGFTATRRVYSFYGIQPLGDRTTTDIKNQIGRFVRVKTLLNKPPYQCVIIDAEIINDTVRFCFIPNIDSFIGDR